MNFEEKLADPNDRKIEEALSGADENLLAVTGMLIKASDEFVIALIRILIAECGARIASISSFGNSMEGNLDGIERAVKAIAKSLEGMWNYGK